MTPFSGHLTSARLRLRPLHRDDAEALCAYRSLPEVARYQGWDTFGPDDAARLIESQLTAEPDVPGTWFQLAIVHSSTGVVIGDCGLHCPKESPRQMEIGITLAPGYQGRRYAEEAVGCLLDDLFGRLDKHRVFAHVDVLNRPAVALCRRLGFRQEAHFVEHLWFKGQWGSEYVFAMLKRDWEERRAQGSTAPSIHRMTVPSSWPPDLTQAARSTESQLQQHGVPHQKLRLEDWEQLSERPSVGVPPWLPPFLATFALCGTGLLLRDSPSDEWGVYFEFLTPERFQGEAVGWIADLPAFGFHAFALGADGDLWIATSERGPSGDIYLLESSGWDGRQPTLENGLARHCQGLAQLLSQLSLIEGD